MTPLELLIAAAWSLPLVALAASAAGWLRAHRRARRAAGGPLPRLLIAQITTDGAAGAAEQVLRRLRELHCPVPLQVWVVVDAGARAHFPGADRVVVVPSAFSCRARAKGRALEWARLERLRLGIAGPDTKILLLDDDSAPTQAYLTMALETDADIAQGVVAPRNHYGRPLSHLDDLRPLHCLAVCSWAQGSGRPVHIHGEGLCLRASAEHRVGWDSPGAALAEDLVFGQRAAALGLRWAFLPAVIEITSPWSARAFLTQRRRWSWGTVQALPHVPTAAAVRIAAFYVITLGAFALSVFGTIDTLLAGETIGGPWPLALAAWLGLFGLAGWIGSSGRPAQALLAIALAWPSALINALVVPVSWLLGPPRRFRTIAKLPPLTPHAAPALRIVTAPALALVSAALLLPALLSVEATLSQAGTGNPNWNSAAERVPGQLTDGTLRAGARLAGPPPRALRAEPDLRRAVTVMAYGNDPLFRAKTNRVLNRLTSLGVTGVSLTVPIYTDGLESNEIRASEAMTPDRNKIIAFAKAAHRRNMTATLSPLLDEQVLFEDDGWRGELRPTDRSAWFSSYAELLSRFAELAEQGGYQGLNVGTELESLQLDPRWKRVLGPVRQRFSGTVSYAMAGSRVLDPRLPWLLHNVDIVGINTWYPLDLPDDAGRAAISEALEPWVAEINAFREELGKPLVFTEAGSRSRVGAYRHQVRIAPRHPVDLSAQKRVYAAVCELRRDVEADGVIWWATTPDPSTRPETDRGFDPLGKPAERWISSCARPG